MQSLSMRAVESTALRYLVSCFAVSLVACGPGDQGPTGLPGPQGEQGAPGPQGPPGEPGSGLQSAIRCTGLFTDRDGFQYTVVHDVHTFRDGSIFTTCTATNGAFAVLGLAMYRPGQTEVSTAPCTLQSDVDTGSNGVFRFALTAPNASRVVYVDQSSPSNNRSAALACQSL